MRWIAAVAGMVIFASAAAQAYKLSDKPVTMEWTKGTWRGVHSFPKVYCLTFPMPQRALKLRLAMFNANAIALTDVTYEDDLFAFIAVSTVPADQTPAEAMRRIAENERRNEVNAAGAGIGYAVSEFSTDFGATVGVVVTNPAGGNADGPFPLTRSFLAKSDKLLTLSVHRLFARGHDRFELIALQVVPQPPAEGREVIAARLTAMADEMVASLQKCTAASIPPRKPSESGSR